MNKQKRIRDCQISIGSLPIGPLNAITDVEGVRVGHCTLSSGAVQTGVTAILPTLKNVFQEKLFAAHYVINGFGKTTGLMQIEELGTLESPIILTNTLSVGTAYEALVRHMLNENETIGGRDGSVNPVICECNDGYLNDIRGLHITQEHVLEAIRVANKEFSEGAVGAGRGMSCFQLKGGIGSSSRVFTIDHEEFTLGSLVLSNFGRKEDLTIKGKNIGKMIADVESVEDKGSIIMIIATDLPLLPHTLKRIAKRASIGLSRVGGYMGNGSGEVVIAFSTAAAYPQNSEKSLLTTRYLHQNKIDTVFRAVAESIEESVLNSMITAEPVQGFKERQRDSLQNHMQLY